MIRVVSLSAVLAAIVPATIGAAVPAQPKLLTCTVPVSSGDTAATLKRRFGKAAIVTSVPGAEGETQRAVVLWPRDPMRRLEVTFWDAKMTRLAGVKLGDRAKGWSVGGVRLGDSLAAVERRNGRPFQLGGFEWDYGGYLQDAKGGVLGMLPGGCRVSVRLGLTGKGKVSTAILGEVSLQSSDAPVRAALPTVTDLAIGWAAPD